MKRRKKMVRVRDLQYDLGISWPPAHRFVDKYGYSKEIVRDPDLGLAVTEDVAAAVVQAFRDDTTVGRRTGQHKYPKMDKFITPDPRRGAR